MSAQIDPRKIEYLPISELNPDERNPKAHDEITINESVGRFGLVDLIVRDERTGKIISGHGRSKVLQSMADRGEAPPEGVKVNEEGEWLVPVVTGWGSRTDTEAAAALIALNRTTELGGWVDESLLELLDELEQVEDGLIGIGFSSADVEALEHLTYVATEDGPVRDLDSLYESVGDPTEEDGLTRVILQLTPETAERFQDFIGTGHEEQESAVTQLLRAVE